MSRAKIRVHQASEILKPWDPETPFALYYKQACRKHKGWGSTDRREIQSLCYAWFRMGRASRIFSSVDEALPWATFLFLKDKTEWLDTFKTEGILPADLLIDEDFEVRLASFRNHFNFKEALFPEAEAISKELSAESLSLALAQPARLWFRVKSKAMREFSAQLVKREIPFEQDGLAISMESGIALDQLYGDHLANYGEVQDWASQQVARAFDWNGLRVWDACSGSGGKALQIAEEYQPRSVFCTDIRPAILQNLQNRFKKSGIRVPEIQVINLSLGRLEKLKVLFDAVLCDVPCTGSGTFRRNPEGMQRMHEKEIMRYALLQNKIVRNAAAGLKKGGHLLYATCSVYSAENEAHHAHFATLGLTLEQSAYVNGTDRGGDILYYALFKKS